MLAFEGEAIGQVMHPELGNLLLGGLACRSIRWRSRCRTRSEVSCEVSVNRGREFCLFVRGAPPGGCYGFRVGAFNGKWLTIVRHDGGGDLFQPVLLTMRALDHETSSALATDGGSGRISIKIEVLGSQLSMSINGSEPLVVQDPCPLAGPLHRQIAVATFDRSNRRTSQLRSNGAITR